MMRKIGFWLVGLALLTGASSLFAASGPENVLVVYNAGNPSSVQLAQYYQSVRSIPAANMLGLTTPAAWAADSFDTVNETDYTTYIYNPVAAAVTALDVGGRIDYIVMCRNLPYKVVTVGTTPFTYSLDAALMAPIVGGLPGFLFENDFFNSTQTFADYKAGNFVNPNASPGAPSLSVLVSRLDGWTWNDAFNLIDQAVALRIHSAQVLVSLAPALDSITSEKPLNDSMRKVAADLQPTGVGVTTVEHFTTPKFLLAGYVSWGWNDPSYTVPKFDDLAFAPGAPALVMEDNPALYLRTPPATFKDQPLQLSQLIEAGLSGGLGQIEGSFLDSEPEYFLNNYFARRWNMIDSLYSSIQFVGNQVMLGDPLCDYFSPGFQVVILKPGVTANVAVGGFSGWHLSGGTSAPAGASANTGVTSNGTVGGTSSWLNNNGGTRKSTVSHGL